ncbi:MalM family protein [Vibrio sp. 10N.261.52.C11]|uniref:MalM family protein n=1 Tax=Vibrio sp. 10N.261.52.C11 TaxID=3229680 RepID=UPI00355176E6
MKNSLLLVSSIGLFGCASTSIEAPSIAPINDMVCCASELEYPWVRLDRTQSLDFIIDKSSPVGLFVSGKSYFSAFAFNEQSKNVDLLIRSNMLDGHVVIPRVDLLNSQFELVETIEPEDFNILFSDAFARNRFEFKAKINAIETPYFVIYADSKSFGNKVVVPHPAILRAQESGEPMPIATNPTYTSSNSGQFSLEVQTKTLQGYSKKSALLAKVANSPKNNLDDEVLSQEQKNFYLNSIESAVSVGMIDKALVLLDEAKALGIEGAQEVFVKSVNKK